MGNVKQTKPTNMIKKLFKPMLKRKISKAIIGKWHIMYRGTKAKEWQQFLIKNNDSEKKVMSLKINNCQPRILYPVQIPFRNEDKVKTF